MGAEYFEHTVFTKGTANDAFEKAVEEAQYDCGHSGYTGTIAEKDSFRMFDGKPEDVDELSDLVNDKWGDAGCIELLDADLQRAKERAGLNGQDIRCFMFFGTASS